MFLGPIIVVTSLASFLGFLSSSALVDSHKFSRTLVGLTSGLCGVIATALTALRNSQKYDVKAEMFRSAAFQYRILATKMEQRIRLHRHLLNDMDSDGDSDAERQAKVLAEKNAFLKFFADSYERISTVQSEMKYFPPGWKLREWISAGALRPNPIDQPMAKFREKGYKLSNAEKERALYLLTNAEVPFKKFSELPEVRRSRGS